MKPFKRILIFDTETNGLPVSNMASSTDVTNWPRIIQLAWELCWSNGDTIKKRCDLVKPDGWTVPTGMFWVDNGFSQADSEEKGLPMPDLLTDFLRSYLGADVIVAHNFSFDEAVLNCEMLRYGITPKTVKEIHPWGNREGKIEKVCTKLASEPILQLPGIRPGQYKWPTLTEAYEYMYGKPFEGAHSADGDVQACKEVYLWIEDFNSL